LVAHCWNWHAGLAIPNIARVTVVAADAGDAAGPSRKANIFCNVTVAARHHGNTIIADEMTVGEGRGTGIPTFA